MTSRRVVLAAGLVVLPLLVLAVGLALAGVGGLVVAAGAVWVVLLGALRARLSADHRTAPVLLRAPPRRPNLAYPSYRRIESALFAASTSRREYDTGARPMLRRLAAARLNSSPVSGDPERDPLGDDPERDPLPNHVPEKQWEWLRPVWPPSANSRTGGIDRDTLAAIVTTLEDL